METKFRGKTKDGVIVYGDLVRFVDKTCIISPIEYYEFIEPDYHSNGMGCGLEDRGIRGRYEAMQYGFESAIEKVYEGLPYYQEVVEYSPFTGVLDKNGVELYLGDLTNYGEIIFENGCFGMIGEIGFFYAMSEWNLNYIEKI